MRQKLLQAFVVAGLAVGSAAAAEMTGWISDSICGAGNAGSNKAERECADRCIKNGAAPVFVSEKDQKVYQVSDAALAKKHLQGKVKVSGDIKGDTITIANIVDIKE